MKRSYWYYCKEEKQRIFEDLYSEKNVQTSVIRGVFETVVFSESQHNLQQMCCAGKKHKNTEKKEKNPQEFYEGLLKGIFCCTFICVIHRQKG